MTNFSDNPGHVRVDFFKPEGGKWYMTEVLDMTDEYRAPSVFAAVRNALAKGRHGRDAEKRWIIVVLEPYHEMAFPVMLTPGRAAYSDYPKSSYAVQVLQGEVEPPLRAVVTDETQPLALEDMPGYDPNNDTRTTSIPTVEQ